MRLPRGPNDGALPRDRVVLVLANCGAGCRRVGAMFEIGHGENVELQYLPEVVPRTLIRIFARKYNIDITEFYFNDTQSQQKLI